MDEKKKKKKAKGPLNPAPKQEMPSEKETGSACDFLSRVQAELSKATSSVEDAKSEIQEGDLDGASDSIQQAMDIIGSKKHHERLERAFEMVGEKSEEIQELKGELL